MLKIERDKKAFITLAVMPLVDADIRERYDLQEYICNSATPSLPRSDKSS